MTTPPLMLAERHAADYAEIEFQSIGSQAEVYSAQYKALRRPERVAIKVMRPDSAPGKSAEEMRARFLAEAEALRSVSHPHVVRVFEIVEAKLRGESTLGFVMEWLETTFSACVRQAPGGLDEARLCRYFEAALKGLGALHEAGIAVRDLRPENLLLNARDQLKLADLGMARTETAVLSIREQSTQYQAPEVLDGSLRQSYRPPQAGLFAASTHDADPPASVYFAADLYSLGLIFYEAAMGSDRWRSLPALASVYGKGGPGSDLPMDKRWENWHTNRDLELPPVGAVRRDVSEAVGRAIDGMVRKDPEQRMKRFGKALAALDACAAPTQSLLHDARQYVPSAAPPVLKQEQGDRTSVAANGRPPGGRRRFGWRTWAGGAVVMAVIALVWLWQSRPEEKVGHLVATEPPHAPLLVNGREIEVTPVSPPAPAYHVTDIPDVLTASEEAALNKRLLGLEARNLTQMVIYIGSTLSGRRLNDFCLKTFNAWRVGDAKRNNGLAVFAFIDDGALRIQVGSGLEEVVTDDFCEAAIRECILPNFRERRFAIGFNELVDRITWRLQDAAGDP